MYYSPVSCSSEGVLYQNWWQIFQACREWTLWRSGCWSSVLLLSGWKGRGRGWMICDQNWSCSKYWMTIARGEDICEKRGREVGWHVRLYQIIFSVTDVMFDLPWAIISKMHMKSGRERVVDMWIMIAGCKYLIPLDEMILDNTTSDVIFLLPLALCWTLTWRGRGRGSKTYNLTWCQA